MPEETPQPAPQPQIEDKTSNKKSKFKFVLILEIIIIFLGLAFAGYLYFTKDKEETSPNNVSQIEKIDTSNWKTYTDTKFNYSVKYPKDWSVVKGGGGQCASLGGGSSEDNICFLSQDFVDEKTTGMGIQVEGRPYSADEYLYKCSDLGDSLEECEDLKVAGQEAIKYIVRSSEVKGTLHVEEMYTFPGKNNESSLFLTVTYFRCRDDGNSNCTSNDKADEFISEVISSFKFLD